MELPDFFARSSPSSSGGSIESEFLDPVISEFANQNVFVAVKCQFIRVPKLTKLRAGTAPGLKKLGFLTGDIEDLDPAVTGVGDPQVIVFVHQHALGALELPGALSMLAPLVDKFSLGSEFLDPVVISVFRHVEVAEGVLNGIREESEFAWSPTVDTANRSVFEQFAFVSVEQHAKIVRVANHEMAVLADRQAARFALEAFRGPPGSEKISIPVKDLNPGCFVNNIKPVLFVDGDGAGRHEPAIVKPFAAPGQDGVGVFGVRANAARHRQQGEYR